MEPPHVCVCVFARICEPNMSERGCWLRRIEKKGTDPLNLFSVFLENTMNVLI